MRQQKKVRVRQQKRRAATFTPVTTPHTLSNERYRIEKVLGAGGMSLVLLAQDTRLGVQRAIKLLRRPFARSEEIRARFLREAFAQADLRHPNILMVHDVVEDEDNAVSYTHLTLPTKCWV